MIGELMEERVELIIEIPLNSKVLCGSCEWQGLGVELEQMGTANLTPGDPVPAGRCPECDALAYVVPA